MMFASAGDLSIGPQRLFSSSDMDTLGEAI